MSARVPGYDELIDWLTMKVAGYLGLPPDAIGIDLPLADCGIDSISGIALCEDLNHEKGFDVETTIVWDYPTIDQIAAYLTGQRGAA
jgi:aryl carrier-like protein